MLRLEEQHAQHALYARRVPRAKILFLRRGNDPARFADEDEIKVQPAVAGEVQVADAFLPANPGRHGSEERGDDESVRVGVGLLIFVEFCDRLAYQPGLSVFLDHSQDRGLLSAHPDARHDFRPSRVRDDSLFYFIHFDERDFGQALAEDLLDGFVRSDVFWLRFFSLHSWSSIFVFRIVLRHRLCLSKSDSSLR